MENNNQNGFQDNNVNPIQEPGNQQYNNYQQNLNNSEKKKSKAPIIITVVVIVILLLGCLVLGGILLAFNVIKKNLINGTNIIENINTINSVSNTNNTNKTNKTNNTIKNNNTTNTINTITTNSQTTVTDAKTSSKENPLTTGTWGIASKYSTQSSEDEEVYVKVTKYTRGEDAKKAVQDYVNSSSIYKYEDPKEGLEWVVVDYEVDFADYTKSSLGANGDVDVSIVGAGDSNSVVYNGTIWILTSKYIGSRDYVKTQTTTGKVAFQMPIGCTEYLLKFGEYNETNAFFKGE